MTTECDEYDEVPQEGPWAGQMQGLEWKRLRAFGRSFDHCRELLHEASQGRRLAAIDLEVRSGRPQGGLLAQYYVEIDVDVYPRPRQHLGLVHLKGKFLLGRGTLRRLYDSGAASVRVEEALRLPDVGWVSAPDNRADREDDGSRFEFCRPVTVGVDDIWMPAPGPIAEPIASREQLTNKLHDEIENEIVSFLQRLGQRKASGRDSVVRDSGKIKWYSVGSRMMQDRAIASRGRGWSARTIGDVFKAREGQILARVKPTN